jgi:ribose-phosphate pyrophosphokinase
MFTKEIQLVSQHDGTQISLNVSQYPDGTPMVGNPYAENNLYRSDEWATMVLRPKTMESFLTGMFLADALEERGRRVRNLVLPFVPGARQDRMNHVGDFLFTAKSVAKMINERKFDQVAILDPHSNVVTGLIDRSVVFPLAGITQNYNTNYNGIIAPDAGAGARTREFAEALAEEAGHGFEIIQAHKSREVATGKLSGFEVSVDKGMKYLVVDDICDGGGTFVGLGQQIVKQGATADLFVTHGIFSKGTAKLNEIYGVVTTTDSTLFEKHDAGVIEITNLMTTWIRSQKEVW